MTHTLNSAHTVAIDPNYYWQPIQTAPRGVKVQLLGAGGVAIYSTYHGDKFFVAWAPLPRIPTDWAAA